MLGLDLPLQFGDPDETVVVCLSASYCACETFGCARAQPEASDQGWGGGTTVETLPSPCRKATWIDGVSIHFVSVHRYFSFGPFVSGR